MRLGVTDSAPRRRVTEPLPITGCIWPSDVRGREAKKGSAAVDAFGHAPCKVSDAGRDSARLGTLRLGRTMILGTSSVFPGRSRRDRAHTACPARLLSRQARPPPFVDPFRDAIFRPQEGGNENYPDEEEYSGGREHSRLSDAGILEYAGNHGHDDCYHGTLQHQRPLAERTRTPASPLVPTTNPGAPTQGVASTLGRTVGSV